MIRLLLTVSCLVVAGSGCQTDVAPAGPRGTLAVDSAGAASPITSADRELWARTVEPYLRDSLWSARDRYDAGHFLMVPLHAAFELNVNEWQDQISAHFARFMLSNPPTDDPGAQTLDWLQYYYLASRFAILATEHGRADLVPAGLISFLRDRIHYHWAVRPVATWSAAHEPFPGEGAQIRWKLQQSHPEYSYYAAIVDAENFIMAIGADLLTLDQLKTGRRSAEDGELREMLAVARTVFSVRGVSHSDGGWLFQQGIWRDYPDDAYAGQPAKVPGMAKAPLADVAEDASHSFRFPLWLRSFREASAGTLDEAFWADLQARLSVQFTTHVLIPPASDFEGWRVTNFMDGRNGVYRWNYATQGPNSGYGPFELSGSVTTGWWGFFGSSQIRVAYRDAAGRFPLGRDVLTLYSGPGTTRQQNPLVVLPDCLTNGFAELLVRLASYH